MKHLQVFLFALLALILWEGHMALAAPATVEQPPVGKPLFFLPIAEELSQQLQPLVTAPAPTPTPEQKPAAPAAVAPPVMPPAAPLMAPVVAPAPAVPAAPLEDIGIALPDNLGAGAIDLLLNSAAALDTQVQDFLDTFSRLPQVGAWLDRQSLDPQRARWIAAGNDLVMAVGGALAVAIGFELLLTPLLRRLRERRPARLVSRLLTATGLLALDLLPVLLFVGLSVTALNLIETAKFPRFIAMNAIYALALSRIVMLAARFLLAPRAPGLRLIPQPDAQAKRFYRWSRAFAIVTVYGYFLIDVARALRVPAAGVSVAGMLLGLALVAMTVAVILQNRALVTSILRGTLSETRYDLTLLESLRLWLARHWPALSIGYIVLGYLLTLIGPDGSFAHLLRGTFLTILTLTAAGLLSRAVARSAARAGKTGIQQPMLRSLVHALIWLIAGTAIAAGWGANIAEFLATPLGHRLGGGLLSIGITVAALAFVYGSVSASIERTLNRQDGEGNPVQASARMRTLLPMVRNIIFILFALIAALVVLAQMGLNIGPLLAGAGALGVAVGFGAQAFVKDIITGFSIVLENTIAIGDVVKIGNHSGTVEKLTMRTVRLRDMDGHVHILPFSDVTAIVNMTREFAYAQIKVGVAYDTDLRKAMESLRAVGDEMRRDAKFQHAIMEPVEVLGVDALADSAIHLLALIRTRPGRQWAVKREYLLRLKERFDAEGIVIPYPTVTNIQKPVETPPITSLPQPD